MSFPPNRITVESSAGNAMPTFASPRKRWIDDVIPDPEEQRAYAEERTVVLLTELIADLMEQAGITRSELAGRLGVNKSVITRRLTHGNMNLRTFGSLLWALGKEPEELRVIDFGTTSATSEPEYQGRTLASANGVRASDSPLSASLAVVR